VISLRVSLLIRLPPRSPLFPYTTLFRSNCHEFSNAAVIEVTPAVEYTMAFNDESCFGANDGTFAITVTDAHGYTLSYTLTHPDATTSMNTSGSFTGLGRGNYTLTVTQTSGEASCDFVETFTIDGPPQLLVEMDLELVQ